MRLNLIRPIACRDGLGQITKILFTALCGYFKGFLTSLATVILSRLGMFMGMPETTLWLEN